MKNIVLFVENNDGGGDQTVIRELKFYGQPLSGTTNMNEFKRVILWILSSLSTDHPLLIISYQQQFKFQVAGKAGEVSH